MPNAAPYEQILSNTVKVYIATVGTAFPAIDATPGVGWELLGVGGASSITEDGLTITPSEEIYDVKTNGANFPTKSSRISETLEIAFSLTDLTLETVQKAFNHATITTTASAVGVAGNKAMPLLKGAQIATRAALIRWDESPYMGEGKSQFELPNVYFRSEGDINLSKGAESRVPFTMVVLKDPNSTAIGTYRAQTAVAG